MEILFAGSVPKSDIDSDYCEDVFKIDCGRNIAALCDGATESYNSKGWANILCNKFIKVPYVNSRWITGAVKQYIKSENVKNLNWAQQFAFERGSFSTLLGVKINYKKKYIKLYGIGDSIAVIVTNDTILTTFPLYKSADFHKRPTLLSTRMSDNTFVYKSRKYAPYIKLIDFSTLNNAILLLLMTDALGELFLRVHEQTGTIFPITHIRDFEEFHRFVTTQRQGKNIKVDDTTLLTIKI